jgi:hypothetical protein
MIEVRRVGELTEQERAIIELEENLHRKNLSALERSQATVRLAAAVGAQLREQAQAQAAQGAEPTHDADVSTPTGPSPESDGKLSKFYGMPTTGRIYEEKPDSQDVVGTTPALCSASPLLLWMPRVRAGDPPSEHEQRCRVRLMTTPPAALWLLASRRCQTPR